MRQLYLLVQAPLAYHPATEVALIGSFPLQTLAKPHTTLDIAVTLPKACLYEKDYINHKYHMKKALWLSTTAAKLKKHAMYEQLSWVLLNNNPRSVVKWVLTGCISDAPASDNVPHSTLVSAPEEPFVLGSCVAAEAAVAHQRLTCQHCNKQGIAF